jgi:hypothetical protein
MTNKMTGSIKEEQHSIAKTINQSLGTLHSLVEKYNNVAKKDSKHSITRTPSDSQLPSAHKY